MTQRRPGGMAVLRAVGVGLLVAWAVWLGLSLSQKPLPRMLPVVDDYLRDRRTYVPAFGMMGFDFYHNLAGVREQAGGSNPYAGLADDPLNARYTYPPLTLLAFAWTRGFSPSGMWAMAVNGQLQVPFAPSVSALVTWLGVTVVVLAAAATYAWRWRARAGMAALPWPFMLGALLISYPVLFELERGNCNALPLLGTLLAAWALCWRHRGAGDVAAGVAVALATGIKPYAIVLLLGLALLRRWRAAAVGLAALALMVALLRAGFSAWLEAAAIQNRTVASHFLDYSHSIVGHWQLLWAAVGLPGVATAVPPTPVVTLVLLAAIAWMSRPWWRVPPDVELAWPLFLWLAAVATFTSAIAVDYNLLYIPLAVLSLWRPSRRWQDHVWVIGVLPWWQPFFLGVTGAPWLLLKLVSVLLVGGLLRQHGRPAARTAAP